VPAVAKVLREYSSAALLGALALTGFIVGASVTSDQLARAGTTAGFAGALAMIVRAFDINQRRTKDKAESEKRRQAAVDETRRVASIALLANKSKHPELVATAANALAHHDLGHQRVPFDEAAAHLVSVVNGAGDHEASERWLRDQIAQLDALRDDPSS
jgi:hypothetical protein